MDSELLLKCVKNIEGIMDNPTKTKNERKNYIHANLLIIKMEIELDK